MNYIEEAGQILRLAQWGLALLRRDTHLPSPVRDNRKFMSARDAVQLIPDGAVVAASGLGAHQRASLLYWALRETFEQTGRPSGLTVMNIGGHGGRGVLPGTLDELARPGLSARFITSHFETFHEFLALAAGGHCELQCIPLGILALLYDAQRRGVGSLVTDTGVGTFLDPRVGRGTPVTDGDAEQLVRASGKRLRYRLPPIDVALFNLPAADRHGNLYARNAAMVGDSRELARAARRNGGLVIANVGRVVDEGYDRVFLPADLVDAIVYHPNTEQTLGFFHRDPWQAITLTGTERIADALDHARLVRRIGEMSGAVPRRGPVEAAVVRLAAATLRAEVSGNADIALGTGMSEDVAGVLFEHGALEEITLLVESGMIGGVPLPGAFFGAAVSPRAIVSTAEFFRRCYRKLDAACLGALEVDALGSVNVSKRGPALQSYTGPGGFIDFTTAAPTIVFVCGWMRQGAMEIADGAMRVRKRGAPKFVARVREVTFNGPLAFAAGKRAFYATPVGLFHLTRRGLALASVFPGIDLRRDILDVAPIEIALPRAGDVPVLPRSLLSGDGFDLNALPRPLTGGARRSTPKGSATTARSRRARVE